MGKGRSNEPLGLDEQFRALSNIFERNGLIVRRENLSSARSFRVKSGKCFFDGKRILFIDKKLAPEQQLSTLLDLLLELDLEITVADLGHFSQHLRQVMERSLQNRGEKQGAELQAVRL